MMRSSQRPASVRGEAAHARGNRVIGKATLNAACSSAGRGQEGGNMMAAAGCRRVRRCPDAVPKPRRAAASTAAA
eukprot:354150-Chlamydomonas_euryale.AAC.4